MSLVETKKVTDPVATGGGTGDMLARNNLSDLDDIPTAKDNLGLTDDPIIHGDASGSEVTLPLIGTLATLRGAEEFVNKTIDGSSNVLTNIAESSVTNLTSDLALKEATANKGASGGYVGLTLFKINFRNAANTFISFFTNTNTAARTYTFQDSSDTIVGRDTTDTLTNKSIVATQLTGTIADARLSTNLSTISGLTATTDNVIQSVGSAWASRTMAQLRAVLLPKSYIFVNHAVWNPAASATYYAGGITTSSPTTNINNSRIYFPTACTITAVELFPYISVGSSAGFSVSVYIRTNGADTTLTTSWSWSGTGYQNQQFTGLSIAVAANDFIQIKIITPAWTPTLPSSVYFHANFEISNGN